jgi:hypothetical protein
MGMKNEKNMPKKNYCYPKEENNKLKRIVADQALDIQALKYAIEKKY